jgi:Tol biopolymer transport system component
MSNRQGHTVPATALTLLVAATAAAGIWRVAMAADSTPAPALLAAAPDAPNMPGLIAYARDSGAHWNVYVADANGENERQITNFESPNWQEHVRWAANGTDLIFDLFPGNATYRVYRVPAVGGAVTELPIETSVTDPSVRPNAARLEIALAQRESPSDQSPHDLVVWNEDDGVTIITAEAGVDERSPDWDPRGERLVYERRPIDGSSGWDLWVVAPDGTAKEPLIAWSATSERLPRWSPDGRKIAFISGHTRHTLGTLHVLDVAGRTVEEYVDLADGPLSWSPDGEQVMFHSPRYTGPVPRGAPAILQQEPAAMGLYVVTLATRHIARLHGGAGGQLDDAFLGGYAPDWLAPSPTPTATPTQTPTPTPSATATPQPDPAHLPALFNERPDQPTGASVSK